jgi:hypothetical protein
MCNEANSFAISCPDGTEEGCRERSNAIINLVGGSRSGYIQYKDNLQELVDYMTERLDK